MGRPSPLRTDRNPCPRNLSGTPGTPTGTRQQMRMVPGTPPEPRNPVPEPSMTACLIADCGLRIAELRATASRNANCANGTNDGKGHGDGRRILSSRCDVAPGVSCPAREAVSAEGDRPTACGVRRLEAGNGRLEDGNVNGGNMAMAALRNDGLFDCGLRKCGLRNERRAGNGALRGGGSDGEACY